MISKCTTKIEISLNGDVYGTGIVNTKGSFEEKTCLTPHHFTYNSF